MAKRGRPSLIRRIGEFLGVVSPSKRSKPESQSQPIIGSRRTEPTRVSARPTVGTATVILQNYGPVTMEFYSADQLANAGSYWSNASWYLRGGSRTHDAGYYAQRIESLEGKRMSGRVVEGPPEILGVRPDDGYLDTDIDSIEFWANQQDFISDAHKPGS